MLHNFAENICKLWSFFRLQLSAQWAVTASDDTVAFDILCIGCENFLITILSRCLREVFCSLLGYNYATVDVSDMIS